MCDGGPLSIRITTARLSMIEAGQGGLGAIGLEWGTWKASSEIRPKGRREGFPVRFPLFRSEPTQMDGKDGTSVSASDVGTRKRGTREDDGALKQTWWRRRTF